jgi:hypothetical protein
MSSQIAFVEDKPPNLDIVAEFLRDSAAANRWTNFGPVWHRLKVHIETTLDLPADRCAVPCASGTHALQAAAALAERDGVKRWIVSSFGFRATIVGPFARAEVVDCNEAGLIDLTQVEKLQVARHSGMVATNPFGIRDHMAEMIVFARRTGMTLIIDNAAGFIGFDRSEHNGAFECLSFHHTKPFGFGEGGCLVLDRALEGDAMAALDFGYRGIWPAGGAALSNGKLSEPAAAFILARQTTSTEWMPAYREQFHRILNIGERLGFRSLVDRERIGEGTYGSVPLICPEPIALESLDNGTLVLQKYYKPLGNGAVSHDLYRRVVNVPCHPGVAAVTDDQISGLLDVDRTRSLVAAS